MSEPRRVTDPAYPDLIGIVGGPMIPCKVVEFSATMAPTGAARRTAAGLDACYDQTKQQVIRYQPAPSPTPVRLGYVDPQQSWVGQHDPLTQVTVIRWACPLRTCEWAWDFLTEEAARSAFLRGGVVREHIKSHDLLEWAQEVIDLHGGGAVPAARYPDPIPREDQDSDGARRPAGPGAGVPAQAVRPADETGHDAGR